MRSCGNTSPPSCKCNFKGLGVRESHIDPAENCEICPTHETCDDDNVLFGHERKRNRREGSCTPCVISLSLSSPLPLPSKYRPSSSGQRYFIHPLHASPQIDSLQTWAEPRTRPRGPSLGRIATSDSDTVVLGPSRAEDGGFMRRRVSVVSHFRHSCARENRTLVFDNVRQTDTFCICVCVCVWRRPPAFVVRLHCAALGRGEGGVDRGKKEAN